MAYVEFLRVRKALYIFAGIVTALMGFLLISLLMSHGASDRNGGFRMEFGNAFILQKGPDGKLHQLPLNGLKDMSVPLGALFAIAAYAAAVFATVVATSLNKERDGLDFPLTRPVSRQGIVLAYFGVDLAGIATAFLFAFVMMGLLPVAMTGLLGRLVYDRDAWLVLALGLGISFMWFGIIQAATAAYRGSGGWISGTSWAFFGILVGLSGATFLGPGVHAVVSFLNLFNPIAYFTALTMDSSHGAKVKSILDFGLPLRATLVWIIGLAGCAIAMQTWKRVEA